MKKTFLYCAVAILMTSLTACNDFLTVESKGKATIPAFLSDTSGLNAALNGAYNTFYDYYDSYFIKYPEVAGNMVSINLSSGSDMLEQYNFTPNATSATTSYYIWYNISNALVNANNIIQYAPQVASDYPLEVDEINNILGQALVLRAICHFDLCRVYAQPYNYTADASHLGVPVLTKTPGHDDNVARSTVKAVYDQILADLTQAATLLTDDVADDEHYASLQAANAMMARVYLYMEDWTNALKYAKLAIGSQTLAQGDDYNNMYMDLNKRGEAIFRLSGDDINGKLKTFYSSECLPADTLISLYDSDDIRLPLLQQNGTKNCIKYTATTIPDNQENREDVFVFRLSEMFLTAAEAAYELQSYDEARTYIQAIVSRAVGSDKATTVLASYTDAALINLIRTERVKELCFEGHNFFDITRWKQDLVREQSTNSTVKSISYPSDLFVLPIPQYELDANENMQPNPTVNK